MENSDVGEQISKTSEDFVLNPKTGRLVSEGHEYIDSPRMRNLIHRGNAIRKGLPPVDENQVRLWRGNRPSEEGKNPHFTDSLEGIALPFLNSYGGELTYIDVPKRDLEKYVDGDVGASMSEFTLPFDLAKKAKIAKDPLRPPPVEGEKKSKINLDDWSNPRDWDTI